MQSTTKIDWFTGVSRYAKTHPLPLDSNMGIFVQCSGWAGYDVGQRELDTGIKRYASTTRPDMGFGVVLSATALSNITKLGKEGNMLAEMWRWGLREYRASRLDLAVDLYDGGELANKVARAARRKVIKTQARQTSVIEGITGKGGVTTYLGSRGSTRFMRIYDKNAESRGAVPTSRFELQANKEYAAELWRSISTPDQTILNSVAYAAINGLVSDWGDESVNAEMQFILSSKPPERLPANDDSWDWISKQVLPTILKDFYSKDDKEHTILQKLIDAVTWGK